MQEHEHPSRSGLLSPWSALGNYGRILDQSKNHVQYVYMYVVCVCIHIYSMYMYTYIQYVYVYMYIVCIYMYASKLHRIYLYQFQLKLVQKYCQEHETYQEKN